MTRILFSIIFIIMLSSAGNSFARPIVADLSLRTIKIDSGFTGTEILLFGARNEAGDIVVVVRGPKNSYIVRKKERVAGIWANRKEITLKGADGFYAVASNRPLADLKNDGLIDSLEIGLDNIKWNVRGDAKINSEEFKNAFIAKEKKSGLYSPVINEVSFIGDTLFRTIIEFPENIPRGTYTAEIYLFSDRKLVGMQSTPLLAYKSGFDAFIFDFAYQHSALYGIIAVFLALTSGWIAGSVFRKK